MRRSSLGDSSIFFQAVVSVLGATTRHAVRDAHVYCSASPHCGAAGKITVGVPMLVSGILSLRSDRLTQPMSVLSDVVRGGLAPFSVPVVMSVSRVIEHLQKPLGQRPWEPDSPGIRGDVPHCNAGAKSRLSPEHPPETRTSSR